MRCFIFECYFKTELYESALCFKNCFGDEYLFQIQQLRLVQTIERVLRHSRRGSHENDVREFEKKCLWHKLPLWLGQTSILQQGMPLCSS